MNGIDWRLPEHRREAFQRFYSFHLEHRTHPGCVYFMLPQLAKAFNSQPDDLAWIVWLNGNTQNPVTTQLLLEVAPTADDWMAAVAFWDRYFTQLEWDTDRRHQKSAFGKATSLWVDGVQDTGPFYQWMKAASSWEDTWRMAKAQPYMGRLSAWSMTEYARILLPGVPDAATLLLEDKEGSRSHRNGLALIAGYDSTYWPADLPDTLGIVPQLAELGESLLEEALYRNPPSKDVSRLTLESALCTYKSWHKPRRRYPNVYADMHHDRIRRAEKKWGKRFNLQWDARRHALPDYLRAEVTGDSMSTAKQNHYLETGEIIFLDHDWPDMVSTYGKTDHD